MWSRHMIRNHFRNINIWTPRGRSFSRQPIRTHVRNINHVSGISTPHVRSFSRQLIRTHVRDINNLSGISTPHGRSFSSNTLSWIMKLKDKASPPEYDKWKVLLYLVVAAGLIFPCGPAVYVLMAYHFNEYEKEIERLRSIASYPVAADASFREKAKGWLFASTMQVAAFYAKAVPFIWRLYVHRVIILPEELKEREYMLVMDLNETLVHSGWTGGPRGWVTVKRPGVDEFLEELSHFYEIVVFSSQFKTYVDAVVDHMDPSRKIKYRLYRFDMTYDKGIRVKDFVRLKRDMSKIIYVTSYPYASSNINPNNTVLIQPWKGTPGDTGLRTLTPFLTYLAKCAPEDVRPLIISFKECPDEVLKQLKASSDERDLKDGAEPEPEAKPTTRWSTFRFW